MLKDLRFETKEEANSFLTETILKYGDGIAGVDECGRGSVAGSLVAGCALLPLDHKIKGIKDSKQLSPKRREILSEEILAVAHCGIGVCDPEEIDQTNIFRAAKKAATEAVRDCLKSTSIDFLLCDGGLNLSELVPVPTVPIIKGDHWFECISAASIIAKVYHDQMMLIYHDIYPQYKFSNNQGYLTAAHKEAIEQFGLTPIHRQSFCRSFIEG